RFRRSLYSDSPDHPENHMTEPETCTGCSARFDARAALVSWGVPAFFNMVTASGVSLLVRCPNCGRQFRSRKMRFFGVLTPNGMGVLVVGVLLLCMVLMVVMDA
ncbi:MAG: hypothetical protein ABIP44_06905, partial [Pseudoxanthomonas sp.]